MFSHHVNFVILSTPRLTLAFPLLTDYLFNLRCPLANAVLQLHETQARSTNFPPNKFQDLSLHVLTHPVLWDPICLIYGYNSHKQHSPPKFHLHVSMFWQRFHQTSTNHHFVTPTNRNQRYPATATFTPTLSTFQCHRNISKRPFKSQLSLSKISSPPTTILHFHDARGEQSIIH